MELTLFDKRQDDYTYQNSMTKEEAKAQTADDQRLDGI